MKRKLRLTRELVGRIPATIADPGPIAGEVEITRDGYHQRTADDILANIPQDGALWVFAFGSLIWKPRFSHEERRTATVQGWQRAFCLGPDTRYRGNPDAPGLMLSLDAGGACDGIVLRMAKKDRNAELVAMLETEPPIPPIWTDAQTPEGTVRCIALVCPRLSGAYIGDLTPEEIADRISVAVGIYGSMPDYLLNTAQHLEDAGIHDPCVWQMQDLVAERLEAMPEIAVGR